MAGNSVLLSPHNNPSITITVYGLSEADSDEIRYVGQTTKKINERLQRHLWQAREKDGRCQRFVSRWIRSCNYQIKIVSLEVVSDDARDAERFWIDHLKKKGARLTNLTHGGEGAPSRGFLLSPEHKAKISAANRRRFSDPVARQRISDANRSRVVTAETRKKMSEAKIGFTHSPEARAKMSASSLGKPKSPEHRAKIAAANKLRGNKMRGVPLSKETRAKLSSSTKGKVKSDKTRARMRDSMLNSWQRRKGVV